MTMTGPNVLIGSQYVGIDDQEEYVLENGHTGYSGVNFSSLRPQNRIVSVLSPYDENCRHRVVGVGLNLEGTCKNQTCRVNGHKVWINKGIGTFNIAYQVYNSKCPICNIKIPASTLKSLGYSRAIVKINGMKESEEVFEWEDKQTDGKLVKHPGFEGDTVKWIYLNIEVRNL